MTLTAFCAATLAQADDEEARVRPASLRTVPDGLVLRVRDDSGVRTVFRPSEEYKCFSVAEWGQMAHLVTDYRWLWHYAIQMETKAALLQGQVDNLEIQMTVLRDSLDVTRNGLDTMTGLLNKEHERRLNSEASRTFEVWAWRVGTVVGLVAAGAFGAAWGVERSR